MIRLVGQKLEVLLDNFALKIDTIEHHSTKALDEATQLLTNLKEARLKYLGQLEDTSKTISEINLSFETQCTDLIRKAKPILEKDLSWGNYLTNLLKAIINTVILAVSLRRRDTFFSLVKSETFLAAENLESDFTPTLPEQ